MVRSVRHLLVCLPGLSAGFGLCAAAPVVEPAEAGFVYEHPKAPPHGAHFEITRMLEEPVLMRGTGASDWDRVDLLDPSVLRNDHGFVAYYSGFNGTVWQTGVATSNDGVTWLKYSGNPVLSPGVTRYAHRDIAANGDAAVIAGQVRLFFQGHDDDGVSSIGEATSNDNRTFRIVAPHPALEVGPKGSWDDTAVGDPNIIQHDGAWYMYYLGMNAVGTQRIGVARSMDGLAWQKYAGNPILGPGAAGEFDENGLGEPAMIYVAPNFYLLYTGRDVHENRNLGVAVARDPVNWRKQSHGPLVTPEMHRPWDSRVICDASIVAESRGDLLVYFGGGSAADPAQDISGNVGLFHAHAGVQRAVFDAAADWSGDDSTEALAGSFPVETASGGRFAWVGPEAEITLTADSPQSLHLVGWIPLGIYRERHVADRVSISVTIGQFSLGSIVAGAGSDGWFDLTFPLAGAPAQDGTYTITFKADQNLPPTSADRRTLSYIVRKIALQ